MNLLSAIIMVVVCIMTIFAVAAIIIAKRSNFTTKQTIDPYPTDTRKEEQQ